MKISYRTDLVVDPVFEVVGEPGRDGADGRDGIDGANGQDGRDGANGRGWMFRGEWSAARSYSEGDVATADGSSFVCLKDHTDREPPNRRFWGLVAAKGERGERGEDGFGSKGVKGDSGETIVVGSVEKFSATFDSGALKGNVVYIFGDGHVDLAVANGEPQALAIGLAAASVTGGNDGEVITSGPVTNEAWNLTPGTVYYLDTSVPGGITTTFPDSLGNRIVIVGAALTPTQLNIDIHWLGEIGT